MADAHGDTRVPTHACEFFQSALERLRREPRRIAHLCNAGRAHVEQHLVHQAALAALIYDHSLSVLHVERDVGGAPDGEFGIHGGKRDKAANTCASSLVLLARPWYPRGMNFTLRSTLAPNATLHQGLDARFSRELVLIDLTRPLKKAPGWACQALGGVR